MADWALARSFPLPSQDRDGSLEATIERWIAVDVVRGEDDVADARRLQHVEREPAEQEVPLACLRDSSLHRRRPEVVLTRVSTRRRAPGEDR